MLNKRQAADAAAFVSFLLSFPPALSMTMIDVMQMGGRVTLAQ